MKRLLYFIAVLLLIMATAVATHLTYLKSIAPGEAYPTESFSDTTHNRRALIIVAHDDDGISCAGTVSGLCAKGWKVRELCFFQQGGIYAQKDRAKNPIRKKSLKQAALIQGLDGIDPIDFNFRRDMSAEKYYQPVPYEQFSLNYKVDSLTGYIAAYINRYKPSVIFTLDNVIGGYGHPDHVLISRLILQYCKEHRSDSGFSVKKIYQPVMPQAMAQRILGELPMYQTAKEVYKCNGMPLPDVQVTIHPYATQKKEVMETYATEQNSIKKIWPYYNWYPAWIYFTIFDREFFRVVDVNML